MAFSQKEYDRLRQQERREKSRDVTRAYLQEHPCGVCGEDDWRVLEFHHRDKKTKRYSIGWMVSKGMPMAEIREEMAKCDVMCSNCHRRHHHEERSMNRDVKRERVYREHEREARHRGRKDYAPRSRKHLR